MGLIFLVGDKKGIVDEIELERDIIKEYTEDFRICYAEINTNTGEGIGELFEKLALQIIAKHNYPEL